MDPWTRRGEGTGTRTQPEGLPAIWQSTLERNAWWEWQEVSHLEKTKNPQEPEWHGAVSRLRPEVLPQADWDGSRVMFHVYLPRQAPGIDAGVTCVQVPSGPGSGPSSAYFCMSFYQDSSSFLVLRFLVLLSRYCRWMDEVALGMDSDEWAQLTRRIF
ncbi:uncharacterized protein LOC118914185 isoform X2 [Manis pentadactyla]|uniref:uncharacterized protein LOC118914185 isoform X2 n=1 Tax=Manis pentadactyla TaxID=143292 RepID=UPI00255CCE4A|nr:uncharacterized protein LOC118914185 isoform X2 [Manis pentadactyla]